MFAGSGIHLWLGLEHDRLLDEPFYERLYGSCETASSVVGWINERFDVQAGIRFLQIVGEP